MDRLLIILVGDGAARRRARRLARDPRRSQATRSRRHRGDREHRPRGADPARSPHRGGRRRRRWPARGVLAQQLNAIESLASVEVHVHRQDGDADRGLAARRRARTRRRASTRTSSPARSARYAASAPSRNATLEAIADARLGARRRRGGAVEAQVPFSSRRRWSALELGGERAGARRAGALLDARRDLRRAAAAERGRPRPPRAGARARPRRRCRPTTPDAPLPPALRPLGLVVLAERLRADAERDGRVLRRGGRRAARCSPATRPATVARDRPRRRHPGAGPPLNGGALPEDEAAAARAAAADAPVDRAHLAGGQARASSRPRRRRPLRRDDRRRRQRRPRAQAGAAGDRAGQRDADGQARRRPRARLAATSPRSRPWSARAARSCATSSASPGCS